MRGIISRRKDAIASTPNEGQVIGEMDENPRCRLNSSLVHPPFHLNIKLVGHFADMIVLKAFCHQCGALSLPHPVLNPLLLISFFGTGYSKPMIAPAAHSQGGWLEHLVNMRTAPSEQASEEQVTLSTTMMAILQDAISYTSCFSTLAILAAVSLPALGFSRLLVRRGVMFKGVWLSSAKVHPRPQAVSYQSRALSPKNATQKRAWLFRNLQLWQDALSWPLALKLQKRQLRGLLSRIHSRWRDLRLK